MCRALATDNEYFDLDFYAMLDTLWWYNNSSVHCVNSRFANKRLQPFSELLKFYSNIQWIYFIVQLIGYHAVSKWYESTTGHSIPNFCELF